MGKIEEKNPLDHFFFQVLVGDDKNERKCEATKTNPPSVPPKKMSQTDVKPELKYEPVARDEGQLAEKRHPAAEAEGEEEGEGGEAAATKEETASKKEPAAAAARGTRVSRTRTPKGKAKVSTATAVSPDTEEARPKKKKAPAKSELLLLR